MSVVGKLYEFVGLWGPPGGEAYGKINGTSNGCLKPGDIVVFLAEPKEDMYAADQIKVLLATGEIFETGGLLRLGQAFRRVKK